MEWNEKNRKTTAEKGMEREKELNENKNEGESIKRERLHNRNEGENIVQRASEGMPLRAAIFNVDMAVSPLRICI